MTQSALSRSGVHAELDRVRADFRQLVESSTVADLARGSDGTRWTNQQLLYHMLFGYLITRNLLVVVKLVSRLPVPVQRGFAGLLDEASGPFHIINYWGSCAGARFVPAARMPGWLDAVLASLQRHLDSETSIGLQRSMPFPGRWDPFFARRMTLLDVYHYANEHYDFHRRQLTLPAAHRQT